MSEGTWDLQNTTNGAIPNSTQTLKTHGKTSNASGAELLTESRCQVARRCLREEHYRYVLGYVPVKSAPSLRFGTLWHHGMDAWWRATDPAMRLGAALAALRSHAIPESDEYELARAQAMLEGYDARWGGEQYEVLAVETEFRAPLINPETGKPSRTFVRAGKLDTIVRRSRTFGMEHKTSGENIEQGSAFWSRLKMGGQASGYIRGAHALGYADITTMIYDVAAKPKLKPLKASARRTDIEPPDEYLDRVRADIAAEPNKYYQRGEIVRLEAELVEHDREMWHLANTLREHHRLGLAPRNTDACERYSRLCSYFGVCAGEEDLNDQRLFQILPFLHSELTPGGDQ